jgi:hypothetical protein
METRDLEGTSVKTRVILFCVHQAQRWVDHIVRLTTHCHLVLNFKNVWSLASAGRPSLDFVCSSIPLPLSIET